MWSVGPARGARGPHGSPPATLSLCLLSSPHSTVSFSLFACFLCFCPKTASSPRRAGAQPESQSWGMGVCTGWRECRPRPVYRRVGESQHSGSAALSRCLRWGRWGRGHSWSSAWHVQQRGWGRSPMADAEREVAGGSMGSQGEGIQSWAEEWAWVGSGEGGPMLHRVSG